MVTIDSDKKIINYNLQHPLDKVFSIVEPKLIRRPSCCGAPCLSNAKHTTAFQQGSCPWPNPIGGAPKPMVIES